MTARTRKNSNNRVLTENPLEGEQLLLDAMFGGTKRTARLEPVERVRMEPEPSVHKTVRKSRQAPKPDHYKIVSISLYKKDIARLEDMVRELKRRGHYKANKSQLIRYALARLDLDAVPREI